MNCMSNLSSYVKFLTNLFIWVKTVEEKPSVVVPKYPVSDFKRFYTEKTLEGMCGVLLQQKSTARRDNVQSFFCFGCCLFLESSLLFYRKISTSPPLINLGDGKQILRAGIQ